MGERTDNRRYKGGGGAPTSPTEVEVVVGGLGDLLEGNLTNTEANFTPRDSEAAVATTRR